MSITVQARITALLHNPHVTTRCSPHTPPVNGVKVVFVVLDRQDSECPLELAAQATFGRSGPVVDGWIAELVIGIRIVIFEIVPKMSWSPEGMQLTAIRWLICN
jgi:hypothetical protein